MADSFDIRELNQRIEQQSAFVSNLTLGIDRVIVGQKHLVVMHKKLLTLLYYLVFSVTNTSTILAFTCLHF